MVVSFANWPDRLDPDGKVARITELLGQTNEILEGMTWFDYAQDFAEHSRQYLKKTRRGS